MSRRFLGCAKPVSTTQCRCAWAAAVCCISESKILSLLHAFGILDTLVFACYHAGSLCSAKISLGLCQFFQIDYWGSLDAFDASYIPSLDLLPHLLALFHVELVVALILDEILVLDGNDGIGYPRNKVSIVRNDDN